MITAIAIDDEKNALGILQVYAEKIDDLVFSDYFTNPESAEAFLRENTQVRLVFLDVNLGQVSGLSLASRLSPDVKIILTTAYAEYAIDGYDLNILDYLLKPFSFERFQRSLQKYRAYTGKNQPQDKFPAGAKLIPANDDFIFVKSEHKVLRISLNELKLIEGAGNYVALYTDKGKVLTLQNLKAFEDYLLPYKFVRVHKSFIISIRHIEAIEHNSVQIAGKTVPIGESYRTALFSFIDSFSKQF